jgi:hypothetical protein
MQTLDDVRAKIRRNFPNERSPLRWGKISDRIIRSTCGRFQVERRGDDDAARYFAFILPTTVIGHRLLTEDHAKQICEQHASPLPLEAASAGTSGVPATTLQGVGSIALPMSTVGRSTAPIEREPGCDDNLGDDE